MELNGAKILYTIHTNIPLLGDFKITPVSYTHLTLPTKLEV